MKEQTAFAFDREAEAYARATDPGTSNAAAADVREESASRLEDVVYRALLTHPTGLTSHEIVEATGLSWNTCTPRIAPLVRKGFVVDSGIRRAGPAGKQCIVWKTTEHPF